MANSPSQGNISSPHDPDAEDDFLASLLNLSPHYEGLSDLDLAPQPQNESIPVDQEMPQENTSHPPVVAQNPIAGRSSVSRRRLSTRDPLSMETMSNLFHLTIKEAAKEAGWGLDNFRKRTRELGIERWPHRKLKSLSFAADKLQELHDGPNRYDKEMLREAIPVIVNIKQELLSDPNLSLGPEALKYVKVAHRSLERERKKNKKIEGTSNNDQ